jgi:hypothetical protein
MFTENLPMSGTSAVRALIQRAFKTCTSESDLKTELRSCKQILVNNGFSNRTNDTEIANYRSREKRSNNEVISNGTITTVFYQNQMNRGYKVDEGVLQSIIHNNTKSTTDNEKTKLLIYF